MMGLRVRNHEKLSDGHAHQNINIFFSLLRYLAKILLGWLTLLTIHSNKYGQAIHDKVGNSVMTFE